MAAHPDWSGLAVFITLVSGGLGGFRWLVVLERDTRSCEKALSQHQIDCEKTRAKTETALQGLMGLQATGDAEVEVLKERVREHARRLERIEGPFPGGHKSGGEG